MSYSIEWRRQALDKFETEWDTLPRPAQERVMQALDDIKLRLIAEPMQLGESRASGSQRIVFQPPVSLIYHVDLRLQIVRIIHARILFQ